MSGQQALPLVARRRRMAAGGALSALLLLTYLGTSPFQDWGLPTTTGSDVFKQVAMLAIALALALGTHRPGRGWRTLALPASLAALLGYAAMSLGWAIDPAIGLRRLLLTGLVIWSAFRAVGELGGRGTLVVLRDVMIAVVIACWLAVLLTPDGIHTVAGDEGPALIGAWRGVFEHKNIAGAFLGFAICLLAFDPLETPRGWRWGTLAAAAVFLIESRSKTAQGVLVVALIGGLAVRPYRPRHLPLLWLALGGVAVGGLAAASMYGGRLVDTLNDPFGFTGRSHIWDLLLTYADRHLWTGAGYGSFWQIGERSPIWMLTNDWVASEVGHGHNGYLDLLVTIGAPGLVLAVAVLFVWPAVLLLSDPALTGRQRATYAAMLIFAFGDNMSESSLFDRLALPEVTLMVVLALIHGSARGGGAHEAWRRRMRGALGRVPRLRIGVAAAPVRGDVPRGREPLPPRHA